MVDAVPPILAQDPTFGPLARLTERLAGLDLTRLLIYLIDLVEDDALPYLGAQFHIMGGEGWDLAESDDARRALIKSSIEMHRFKGTPWAIRELVRRLGFGEIELIEGLAAKNYDGKSRYMGWQVYGDPTQWARYRVILNQPITRDQADRLRLALPLFAPARCHLAGLHYSEAAHRYNAKTRFNGDYTHGVI
ncbi:MAG TPA: phage tail protein [Paucimonas sp.]|nr:phage tail protein [Paucimonas sp.]